MKPDPSDEIKSLLKIEESAPHFKDGEEIWLLPNGKTHRVYGPAWIRENCEIWCINGENHREDGPAIIFKDGDKEWWKKGNLHREDGPAVEYFDGTVEYWLNGFRVSLQDLLDFQKENTHK